MPVALEASRVFDAERALETEKGRERCSQRRSRKEMSQCRVAAEERGDVPCYMVANKCHAASSRENRSL